MVLLPAMRTDHLLKGLRRYKEYEVRTLAYNLAGDGPNSTAVRCMTDEDVPGKPALVRFTDIAMTSLNLSWSSPRKPNGVITGYKVIYRTANSDEGIKIERDMTADSYWWHVQGLRERVSYTFQVAAKTSKGLGLDQVSNITTGPQPGSPGSPSQPDVSESESSVTLSWNEGPEGTSSVTHYTIDKYKKDDEEHDGWDYHARTTGSETQFIISYLNLETSSDYRFRVTAVNKQGVSEPSEPTQWITTPMLDMLIPRPFYEEWWFLVIIALISLILLILVVAFLCYKGKNVKHIPKSESQIPTMNGDQFNTIDDGGFATFEMENQYRGSLRSNHSNRSRASRRSTSRKKAYARAPPRPSPGSVTYSDEELEEEEEGPRPYAEADPDSSSLTDKPSEYGDSTGDSQGSETDSGPDSMAKRDASAFTNHYAQASSQSVWRPPVRPPKQQHSYTDSDASQALNNGHIIINNMAGSRAPIPGFSSFV
ncbi:PREDICTED: protein sidekick-like isoform X2 [Priapulus caudatus]|uniref:Protein sidekick-like isoform X2 n=1 Tax=Priapulus caudatus TaxID=37621 RepID=A0ABM1E239_PRICU|nr:PREDICTED: protein sidekick-like isoform X2 [Priapulus caudatus]